MKKHLLIIGICIVILLIPISSAVNVDTDVDDEVRNNYEIEPLDNYEEIITRIDGGVVDIEIKGSGLIRHAEMWAGTIGWINLYGWKHPLFPTGESEFHATATHVIAPIFIGFSYQVTCSIYSVKGIALGTIEWS